MPQELSDRPQRSEKKRLHVDKFLFWAIPRNTDHHSPITTWICVNRWQRQRGDLEDTPYKKATCSNKGHDKDLTLGCRSPCTQPRNRRASSHTSGSPPPRSPSPGANHCMRNDDGFRAVFIHNHLGTGETIWVYRSGFGVCPCPQQI